MGSNMTAATVDAIRAIATYVIALVVVIGGGWIIYTSRGDPAAADTVTIAAAFVGAALTFVFQQEGQARTARQSNISAAAGAAAVGGNGNASQVVKEHQG